MTVYTYDQYQRLIRIDYADNTAETFAYDTQGNRMNAQQISATNVVQTTRWSYDNRNRLQSETQANGAVLTYAYDLNGNRTQIKVVHAGSTQITDYGYDELNRLHSVTDATGTTTYGYDAVGNRTSISYPNGTSQVYRYNNVNRLIALETYGANGALVEQYDYTLSATGQRLFIDELDGRSSAYVYDLLKRLTSEKITGTNENRQTDYAYDKVGNRLRETIDGAVNNFVYDANDRLTSNTTTSFIYDDNGNTLSETKLGEVTSYIYSAKNQLQSATNNSGSTQFVYNVDGIRTQKISGTTTTNFIVDSNQSFAQVLNEITGTTRTIFTYGDDLISQRKSNQTYFYHYDGLGSTRQLSNQAGIFTDSYDYQAFGEILNQTGTTQNNYLFTGEQFDQSLNQYYLRARYYDQSNGRFTQMDTYAGNSSDPITLHKYLYANADGVNFVDPSGNMSNLAEAGAANSMSMNLQMIRVATVNLPRVAANDALWVVAGSGTASSTAAVGAGVMAAFALDALRSKRDRFFGVPIIVFGKEFPDHTQHILDAQMGLGSNDLPITFALNRFSVWPRGWYNVNAVPECNSVARKNSPSKGVCDEYPFASTRQGGPANYLLGGVSLRLVSASESSRTGNFTKNFYKDATISIDGFSKYSRFLVLSIPGANSFYTSRSGKVHTLGK